MKRGRWLLLLAACASEISPLSLDVNYSADAPRLAKAEALAGLRVGVARFTDARQLIASDLHARSYVAHDGSYHLGLTWNGRTFTATAAVIQGLLISELERAGVNAVLLDAEIDADDAPGAAARHPSCDVVLGGTLRGLSFNQPGSVGADPTIDVEVALFEMPDGKPLLHAPFKETHHVRGEVERQRRVDELLDRTFRPVAHLIVDDVGQELTSLAAARLAAAALPPPSPEPEPQSVEPSPEPSHHHHKVHHR